MSTFNKEEFISDFNAVLAKHNVCLDMIKEFDNPFSYSMAMSTYLRFSHDNKEFLTVNEHTKISKLG